jgi:hypothetical protein
MTTACSSNSASSAAAAAALQEYFTRILKKLKQVGATADRTNFYV